MKNNTYSSKDFSTISAKLIAETPEKLIHRDVLKASIDGDIDLSKQRNHLVRVVDLPSKTISMTIGGLSPMQSTREHRHSYETMIYIIEGEGGSIINNNKIYWKKGDAIYIPVWAFHSHFNSSKANEVLYLATENAPLLQSLGVALREEK
ncbi:Gentisate 1,2-dioxygenase [Bathymodiolus heckerae thiotrophic gill symbiont]|uniref:cupin domain-containing protein n=1 Tax=Bathymodiolus heckerae thiotrophic gill symbiont TaxID=1052212 RepID=UPI0010B4935C|nr:cupin domain-containing protein [Bathymodiolus heckerae thiotrophic gill symbiont]SHN92708.1 Gentisate 1,2-dioxygenase [Bathymodiolus heckerae thiotrophic gill symbiont]